MRNKRPIYEVDYIQPLFLFFLNKLLPVSPSEVIIVGLAAKLIVSPRIAAVRFVCGNGLVPEWLQIY